MIYDNAWDNFVGNATVCIAVGIVIFIVAFFICNPPTVQEQDTDAQIAEEVLK